MPGAGSTPSLLVAFAGLAAVVWLAGSVISEATDRLDARYGISQAVGGMVILGVVTNLPEIAIVLTAALHQRVDLAVGNILGAIAAHTVVLSVLDLACRKGGRPLMYCAASRQLTLEGLVVIAILALVVMGHQLRQDVIVHGIGPVDLAILAAWIIGLLVIGRARGDLQAADACEADSPQPARPSLAARLMALSLSRMWLVFALAAAVTLIAGALIERVSSELADRLGMDGVVFGATFLAAATALPELSTGLAAVRLGRHRLAVSDIFGGNAFLPCLFLLAAALSGQPVLPLASRVDIYLTALGIILTVVYTISLVLRSPRRLLGMGVDSAIVLGLYGLGIAGLAFVL